MDLLLSVPGIWDNENQIYQVPQKVPEYFFQDNQQITELLVKPHNPDLVEEFRFLLPKDIPEKEFERLNTHTHNAFLAGEVKNHDDLMHIIRATSEIVKTGGMAVRIESSQTAVTAAEWLLLQKDPKKANLFKTFVGFLKISNYVQSFGMQILGRPDARIAIGTDEYYAYNLLRNFLFMGYMDNLTYQDKQIVSLYKDEPEYKVHLINDDRGEEDLFYNAYGIWELVKHTNHG